MDRASRDHLRDEVQRLRGYWHPFHEGLLDLSPDYLEAYLRFQNAPAVAGNLDPKVCEFVYIAVDGAVSHLYASDAARHIQMALDKGATKAEILEVIQLATLSAHMSLEAGMPALFAAMRAAGQEPDTALTAEETARKQSFIELTGYWPEWADGLFRYAPHFIDAYLRYAEILRLARQASVPGHMAPVIAFLGSDAASGLNGQIIGARGSELYLYGHPSPARGLSSRAGWSAQWLETHLADAWAPFLFPLEVITDVFNWAPAPGSSPSDP